MTDVQCEKKFCYAPDTSCNMGETDLKQCPHWRDSIATTPTATSHEGNVPLPWSGNSFGIVDLQIVSGRSKPFVVGVVGSHNAGKTSFLATLYLLLTHGQQLRGRQFAGSYTLGGWENLAHYLRWKPGKIPTFPPHTPRGVGRVPGLLHLAFRQASGSLEDVLFTDAAGEWFESWAFNQDAPEAAGARWVNTYTDAFMLFVDREALAGEKRGEARTQVQQLAQRLSSTVSKRRVAVVWAKSDVTIPEGMHSNLQMLFDRLFPHCRAFDVTVHASGETNGLPSSIFLDILLWLLDGKAIRIASEPEIPLIRPDDPFFAYRGS